MPSKITIENLRIEDSNHPDDYEGPTIFSNFNSQMTDASYIEKFPFVRTKHVILKNVITASGKDLRLSDNLYLFKDVKVESN